MPEHITPKKLYDWLVSYHPWLDEDGRVKLVDSLTASFDLHERRKLMDRDELIYYAKLLRSESGENPEYDRALVELIHDVTGMEYSEIAWAIDLRGESLRRTLAR